MSCIALRELHVCAQITFRASIGDLTITFVMQEEACQRTVAFGICTCLFRATLVATWETSRQQRVHRARDETTSALELELGNLHAPEKWACCDASFVPRHRAASTALLSHCYCRWAYI
jgi:hypothetical protein